MNLKIKIPNIKLKKSFKKGSSTVNPAFYWNIVLATVLVLVLFAFIYGFILFRKVNKDLSLSIENAGSEAGSLQIERINRALDYFHQRTEKSAEIKSSPAPVVDPSL